MVVIATKAWDSCHQGRCSCADEFVSCFGVDNPYFDYKPMIKYLYLENVYITYVKRLAVSFPNLRLISLQNMQYINCMDIFSLMPGGHCDSKATGKLML